MKSGSNRAERIPPHAQIPSIIYKKASNNYLNFKLNLCVSERYRAVHNDFYLKCQFKSTHSLKNTKPLPQCFLHCANLHSVITSSSQTNGIKLKIPVCSTPNSRHDNSHVEWMLWMLLTRPEEHMLLNHIY